MAHHRPLGCCVPIQCHQINPKVGDTFFFEQFVYSQSGLRSLSPSLSLFYHLYFFSLFFFHVKVLLLGVPLSFLQSCLYLSSLNYKP